MGEKFIYRVGEINQITVPILEELSVLKVLEMIKGDDHVQKYFPDEFFTKKIPERKFFFDVLNTVYEDFLPPLISHAESLRIEGEVVEQQQQVILATDEWMNELKAAPFFSKVR